jgi:hypothetical protein
MSTEKIEGLDFILMPQPSYLPDLTPCDFFLFGDLERNLEGKQFTTEEQVISPVREVFDKILLHTFQNMMDDWQYRLGQCIQLGGRILSLKKDI